MNWPGAFRIMDRLQKYSDDASLRSAVNACIAKARECGDKVWESNLCLLLERRGRE